MKLALRKLKQLTHEKTVLSDVFPPSSTTTSVVSPGSGKFGTFPRKRGERGGSEERGMSPGAMSNKGKSPRGSGDLTDFDRDFPPAEVKSKPRKNPLKKIATVQIDSQQAPAFSGLLEKVSEEREEGGGGGEGGEEADDLHLVFQLCRDVSPLQSPLDSMWCWLFGRLAASEAQAAPGSHSQGGPVCDGSPPTMSRPSRHGGRGCH